MTNEEMEVFNDELRRCEWWEILLNGGRLFGPTFVTLATIMGIREHFQKDRKGYCRIISVSRPDSRNEEMPYQREKIWHIDKILKHK